MKKHRALFLIISVPIALNFLIYGDAYAYIDPGTGSYFLQMLLAMLLGGLFAIKIFWSKIKSGLKSIFRMNKNKEKKNKDNSNVKEC